MRSHPVPRPIHKVDGCDVVRAIPLHLLPEPVPVNDTVQLHHLDARDAMRNHAIRMSVSTAASSQKRPLSTITEEEDESTHPMLESHGLAGGEKSRHGGIALARAITRKGRGVSSKFRVTGSNTAYRVASARTWTFHQFIQLGFVSNRDFVFCSQSAYKPISTQEKYDALHVKIDDLYFEVRCVHGLYAEPPVSERVLQDPDHAGSHRFTPDPEDSSSDDSAFFRSLALASGKTEAICSRTASPATTHRHSLQADNPNLEDIPWMLDVCMVEQSITYCI
ncbi:hypothetical protein B0H21DRAFT_825388 [Amylocystis lapponica]|nr:hypothetical protein B0H21DRAFT_825388 [Amylocystis lapponica]